MTAINETRNVRYRDSLHSREIPIPDDRVGAGVGLLSPFKDPSLVSTYSRHVDASR